MMIMALALAGCPKKKPAPQEAAPLPPPLPAPAQKAQPAQAAEDAAPAPHTGGPPAGRAPDTQPGAPQANVTGSVFMSGITGKSGNLFVYIIDEASFDPSSPKPVASQVIPRRDINGEIAEFKLMDVPPGEYQIIALWDTAPPYCDVTDDFCAMGMDDMVGTSEDIISLAPGATYNGARVRISPDAF